MGTDQLEARRGVYVGVFFTSLSVLSLELVLTRIFSVTMYYHFAFMAISLALFGSGVSGVYVFLNSRRFSAERAPRQMAVCSLLMALSVLLSLVALLRVSVGLLASFRTYLILAGLYAVCALPFFFGGACLSLAMKHLARKSGRLYFFDLIGAAAGCLLVIPVINALGGPGTMLAVSVACAAGALSFTSLMPRPRNLAAASVATGLLFIALISANQRWDLFTVVWAKGTREKTTIFAKWNSFSRVTVSGDINDSKPLWITIDSDAGTPILRYSNNPDAMQYVERAVSALAYQIKTQPKVLVIGPGGGREVVTAIESGSTDITGVEVNPLIVRDIMQTEPYRSFSGNLYNRPEVNAVVDEGRAYIRGTDARFDIIQASLIDTWAANSAGAFALSENNLYTVEAFKLYLDRLKPDGILTMTRWLLDPPQQELRLVSLARETMRQLGVQHPENHLCLFKAPGKGERIETCFIFKKSEFTSEEVAKLEQVAAQNKCEVLYTPGTRPQNVFTELATASNPDAFYNNYPINIRPTFDNSPFFFYHVRSAELLRALTLTNESRKTNMGVFVLFALLVITSILVGTLMLAPLAVARRRMPDVAAETTLKEIVYFAFLGLGFIVIEMAMIQRFILFLGYPVYALAVVLFSLLLWSGVGSLATSRVTDGRLAATVRIVIATIIGTTAVYLVALPGVFEQFGGSAVHVRIMISVALLLPLGLLLGVPMPAGIRLLGRKSPRSIPWAWGVNGATSVLGSVVSIIVAMNWGFNQALALGAATYFVALLFVRPLAHAGEIVLPEVRETPALTEHSAEAVVEG